MFGNIIAKACSCASNKTNFLKQYLFQHTVTNCMMEHFRGVEAPDGALCMVYIYTEVESKPLLVESDGL